MVIIVIAENNKVNIDYSTQCVIKAASHLSIDIDLLLFGKENDEVVKQSRKINCIRSIICVGNIELEFDRVENISNAIFPLLRDYTHIFIASTSFGKSLAPRLAAKLDVAQISNITKVIDSKTYERPVYTGKAIQVIKSNYSKIVVTVRVSAFDAIDYDQVNSVAQVRKIHVDKQHAREYSRLVQRINFHKNLLDLSSANIVVAGGFGLGSKDNFDKLIKPLACILNAAIGATRAAVEANYISNDFQIGQTGKSIAPSLYIAIGVSGAIQHIAGICDSKIIVAINKDINAPIFNYATYGMVGDLFSIVPKLVCLLSKK